MPGTTHLFNTMWSGQVIYVLARKQHNGSYIIESINGFPVSCFPKSVLSAAERHFEKMS